MNGMVSCKNCMAHNSLDSAFCKKCGATLPADDVQLAKERLEAAVADGFKIFNSCRTDEAMHIAETAVAANPGSTAALSLKAMCHERLGQISEALECHERVLEIDPDSMIDKIKVNDLRNLLVARSSIAAVPDRKMAIVGAVAAFVLVASIGIVIAKTGNRGEDKVAMNTPAVTQNPTATGSHFESPATPPGAQTQPTAKTAAPQQNTQAATNEGAGEVRQPNTNQQPVQNTGPGIDLSRYNRGGDRQLPNAGDNGTAPLIVKPDFPVKTTPTTQPPITPPNTGNKGDDPEPGVYRGGNEPTPQQKEAPGIMDIKVVSRGGKPTGDGNDSGSRANGVEALLRTARNQYQTGNYTAAATSYERALRSGADPASGNQRLAECYEKLGRDSEALAAYHRAIAALQADLDGGRGEKGRLSAALETCKQAVKVLGG